MGFEQAAIRVAREREFAELKGAIARIFVPEKVEEFLRRLQKRSIRVRDFDLVLASGTLEECDKKLAASGKAGRQWYQELTTSDQALLREFYLSKIEEVEPGLRARFQKLYQYY